ncbi:MAG: hypothetical protein ACKOUR_17405, partial [Planctomycetota bacterium]
VDYGANSFWSVCVDYTHATTNRTTPTTNLSCSRVDYEAFLPQDEFAVFCQLRETSTHRNGAIDRGRRYDLIWTRRRSASDVQPGDDAKSYQERAVKQAIQESRS